MKRPTQILNNHRNLAATVFSPDKAAKLPAIILGAGWMNTLENNYEFAQEVAEQVPAVVVVFDYSGIGSSEGDLKQLSRKDHLQDFQAVYDWVAAQDTVDPERIGVNGGSYSGYIAAMLTASRRVKSLLLRAPAIYSDDTFAIPDDTATRDPEGYYENIIRLNKAQVLVDALANYKNSLLVQERESDEIITRPVIEFYLRNNHSPNQKHIILKGAGHKLSGELKAKSTKECEDWFRETL